MILYMYIKSLLLLCKGNHYGHLYEESKLWLTFANLLLSINPLTPKAFCQKCIFDILEILHPGYEPNLLQSTQKSICNMIACLSFHLHRVLRHFCLDMRRSQSDLSLKGFRFFFLPFLFLLFLSFRGSNCLLGLLPVQKCLRKHHRDGQS